MLRLVCGRFHESEPEHKDRDSSPSQAQVARHRGGISNSGSPGRVMVLVYQITSESSLDAACGGG